MDAEGDKVSTSLQAVALDILQTLVRAYAVNENSSQHQQHTVSQNSFLKKCNYLYTDCTLVSRKNCTILSLYLGHYATSETSTEPNISRECISSSCKMYITVRRQFCYTGMYF